jgi:catechol 2,3-dioxygenase-like lactoylglutathione lyase family enzyme
MIDHISIGVSDYKRSRAFYKAVLKPLGFTPRMTFGESTGYGTPGKPFFWIGTPEYSGPIQGAGTHFAFTALDRKAVDAFYKAALKHGAIDNGKPGLRPDYHPNYYGAFVIDPDGHRIEAVCHQPEGKKAAPKKKAAQGKPKVAKTKAKSKTRR